MCGIAGLLGPGAAEPRIVAAMIAPLEHRGPDDVGLWSDAEAGVALGHRRLAIVDLSAAGHEPMVSASGRLVVTYNGEIYNHAELRARAGGGGAAPRKAAGAAIPTSRPSSRRSTTGGWSQALDRGGRHVRLRLVGPQGAAAVAWSATGSAKSRFITAGRAGTWSSRPSSRRSARIPTSAPRSIARPSRAFASRGYIPAPRSIYRGIYKLQPGCILTVAAIRRRADGDRADGRVERRRALAATLLVLSRRRPRRRRASPSRTKQEALDAVEAGAGPGDRGPVARRRADRRLPVGRDRQLDRHRALPEAQQRPGAHLLDRLCRGAVQRGGGRAARWPSIWGPSTTNIMSRSARRRDVIPLLPDMYDEPFADFSQIPTFLVSRFARDEGHGRADRRWRGRIVRRL